MKFYKSTYTDSLYMILDDDVYIFAETLEFYRHSLFDINQIKEPIFVYIDKKLIALMYPEIFNAQLMAD